MSVASSNTMWGYSRCLAVFAMPTQNATNLAAHAGAQGACLVTGRQHFELY